MKCLKQSPMRKGLNTLLGINDVLNRLIMCAKKPTVQMYLELPVNLHFSVTIQ